MYILNLLQNRETRTKYRDTYQIFLASLSIEQASFSLSLWLIVGSSSSPFLDVLGMYNQYYKIHFFSFLESQKAQAIPLKMFWNNNTTFEININNVEQIEHQLWESSKGRKNINGLKISHIGCRIRFSFLGLIGEQLCFLIFYLQFILYKDTQVNI